MLKGTWKLGLSASIFLIVINLKVTAQTHQDSVMARQVALAADFVNKIKAAGLTPSLSVPKIILDNPRSFGNYDDSLNMLHTCDWTTLPPAGRAVFEGFAAHMGNGMTAEKFFNVAVYQWIFIHELGHWWRACQHVTAEPYENEKAANRIASAYWNDKDPAFYKFILSVFHGVVDHSPSPVPAEQEKAKYLDDNYQKLPGGSAYTWYQAIMIVEIGTEKPFETFKQAVVLAGKPLK